MYKFFNKNKYFFQIINILIIILYLYPGSILGYIFLKNYKVHPQITKDFIISSNHFYIFAFLSILGLLTFHKTIYLKLLILYLFFLSLILEILHIIIPERGFEFSDLFGNIFGVLIIMVFYKLFKYYESSKK
tara:strand:- start:403 stop:798 length:396 start_codon:yes stop_codon:yes gene_type:complete